jgi:type I restriction enzyme S subunit
MAGEWRSSTWGEEVSLEYGKALRGYEAANGGYRVFGSNGPIGWTTQPLAAGPGVILGRKGAYRGVQYSPDPFYVIDTAYYVVPKTQLDMRWLYYAIQHYKLGEVDDGSPIPSTTRSAVYVRDLEVPPPAEQRAIAHILGTLDDKIEVNRRINETLEAMARALFRSWFVNFDPVRAKAEGRDPGPPTPLTDLFPDYFEDSKLGRIPKGWRVRVLSDVLSELETGGRPKGGVSGYATGTPSIGAESIVGLGLFDYSKTKYVPDEFFKEMTKGRIKSRDVLLYKDGGRPGEFEPHVTLFGDGFPFDTCAINEHVYRLRAKQELGQNLLFFWLSSDLVMEEMRIKGTGVAIPGLNSTQVRSLTTLVPTFGVAKAFDALVDPWISGILANCNESLTLAALRDALLPKLISGELRIEDTERIIRDPPGQVGST